MKTYDVHFNDSSDSSNKGFSISIEDCKNWIEFNRSELSEYAGGTVSIVCNETGEEVYSESIL
ncbi:MAG: hypothetical protein GY755_13545 [Chloroflexi bacterium]|nr:hypothetical protein [Chloroflexota bacterium]